MNEKETIKILATIAASYPSVERLNETAIQGMTKVWARMFRDDDAKLVGLAVGEHIATSKFPPSVAEIRERLMKLQRPDILTPEDAWSAVQNVMYVDGEFCSTNRKLLPTLVRQALNQIGWASLFDKYMSNNDPRTKFLDAYMPLYRRERDRAMLPPSLASDREQIQRIIGAQTYRNLDTLSQICADKRAMYRNLFPDMYGDEENELEDGGEVPALQETN